VQLLVHGGAGSPPDAPAERGATLATAAERGGKTATPLDAVCAAVRVLEADPRFNAGVGGAVQSDGRVAVTAAPVADWHPRSCCAGAPPV
jgi:isoaspartyl peptidase/L-asparaginase-like protein (Ntn-hydrolase superfamily)